MSSNGVDKPEIAKWDPGFTRQLTSRVGPLIKRYFRAEVRGLESIPQAGGALVVSNHSGGMFTPDVLIFAPAFYEKFGFDRPVYTLAHWGVFMANIGDWLHRAGVIEASRENAAKALREGAIVLVFPGGDYDAYRPTMTENVIDFGGRTGYVRTAIESGVPIVPVVSIGAQETQLFIARGDSIARRLGLKRLRAEILPISFGFPFGLSAILPPNIPLPSKIVTRVLEPIDITAEFGEDPDVDEVDLHVRATMQKALDELASERRYPVLG
ncbi:1-acyl-sn-glycerol-3-phosphate acyltransferase [Mycobacterium sp. JS623]|uniref:lysophospholipid acyltransferase family protein n=1 Tax=Mycobacterium sp. JS623 TaxID=212767 RepID=UPI0002A570B0|nr:lysophospholipid acyltransferase family protein [Mycobacterium sp. JS623]AGB24783.1 1-acyl-sn-glycerol-3-phosphate acyltransferase [Mycobacterium sp. JS623]